MAIPPVVVAGVFLVAALIAAVTMIYIAYRGSKNTDFYSEVVSERYDLELPEAEIDAFYDLKDRLQAQVGVEDAPAEGSGDAPPMPWAHKLPPEERQSLAEALMRRLVKTIDRLDRVQSDKPGNYKLWQKKLVSEHFWASLVDAEKLIGEEVDSCMAEADEIQLGWREHIFPQAVQQWRRGKQIQVEKKDAKKAVIAVKKEKEKAIRRVVVEAKQAEEDIIRQEKNAEKMMEKLLREEENASKKAKDKSKVKEKAKAKKK